MSTAMHQDFSHIPFITSGDGAPGNRSEFPYCGKPVVSASDIDNPDTIDTTDSMEGNMLLSSTRTAGIDTNEEEYSTVLTVEEPYDRTGKPNNPSILVIDDESHICTVLREYFTISGYQVTTRTNGEEGIACFKANHANIVVTDLNMPGLTGLDIARVIKTLSPATTVILISGYPINHTELGTDGLLVDHIIPKPLDFKSLAAIVRER
jgi:CheY-like chemotaxis protein